MTAAKVIVGDVYAIRPLGGLRAIAKGVTSNGLVVMATADFREVAVAPSDLTPVTRSGGTGAAHDG